MIPVSPAVFGCIAMRMRCAISIVAVSWMAGCGTASRVQHLLKRDLSTSSQQAELPEQKWGLFFHNGITWVRGGEPYRYTHMWGWMERDGMLVRGYPVGLTGIDMLTGTRIAALRDEGILTVHQTEHELWVLSDSGPELHLWRRVGGGFELVRTLPPDDKPSLTDWEGRLVLLFRHRVEYTDRTGRLLTKRFSFETFHRSVLAVTSKGTLFGGGAGRENSGDLYEIALAAGDTKRLCVNNIAFDREPGPVYCEAVNGIIPDPERPDCVIVGGGSWHEIERGWLRRICEASESPLIIPGITMLKQPAWMSEMPPIVLRPGTKREPEIELEGLESPSPEGLPGIWKLSRASGRDYWLTTSASIYLVHDGRAQIQPRPIFVDVGGVLFGRIPGALVALHNREQAASERWYWPRVLPVYP